MRHIPIFQASLIAGSLMLLSTGRVIADEAAGVEDDAVQVVEPVKAEPAKAEADAVEAPDAVEAVESPGPAETVEPPEQAEAAEPVHAVPISMDRSDWPHIVLTPADGTVTHNPQFVGNVPMREDEISPLDAPDPVWQVQEALNGDQAQGLGGENLLDLVTQPVIGTVQIVLIPIEAVIENPWSDATSP